MFQQDLDLGITIDRLLGSVGNGIALATTLSFGITFSLAINLGEF